MPKELNTELAHIYLSKTILKDSMVDLNMIAKENKLLINFISSVFSWLSGGLTNRTLRDFGVTTWISHTVYGMGLIFFRVQMALLVNLCKFPLTSHKCTVLSLRADSMCLLRRFSFSNWKMFQAILEIDLWWWAQSWENKNFLLVSLCFS